MVKNSRWGKSCSTPPKKYVGSWCFLLFLLLVVVVVVAVVGGGGGGGGGEV